MSRSRASLLLCSSAALLLAGCGATLPRTALTSTPAATFSGRVHGGEQPVSGAFIQLYTIGITGDGSASTPLLSGTVTSDASGNFNITGLYSCTAATQVYLVASGGNPGLSAPNPNLALMTALGPCTSLTPQTFISVNELTTIAAVYALQPFMTDYAHIGSSSADVAALNAAFTLANQLVSSSAGTITGSNAPRLNTLADILAACVNTTGGSANDGTTCGKLFAVTPSTSTSGATPPGTTPTDTITALLNIASNPNNNVTQLYNLTPAAAPYQPTTTTPPPDLGLPQTPSANAASGLQIGPPVLTFPSTGVGVTSPSQTIVVSNPTTSPITLAGVTLNGVSQSDFAESSTCAATLAPATNCTISISFTPQATAARGTNLTITSNTPDSPQQVAVSGEGIIGSINGPHPVVSHAVINLYPGSSYDVALSNIGNAPLTVLSISLANTPFNTQSNDCPASLASGASCTITIHSLASGTDQLSIATNDASFASNILIFAGVSSASSAVQSADGSLSPSNLFFPDTAIGSNSTFSYSYVANTYPSPTPTVTGPPSPDFTVGPSNCTTSVTHVVTCGFTVNFNPSAAGLRTARLGFDSTPNYIPLAGIGTTNPPGSGLTISPATPGFDYNPAPETLTLTNYGNGPISIQSIAIESIIEPSEFSETNNCGTSLAAQSICTIKLASNRLTQGATQAILTVTSSAGTYDLPLSNTLHQVINFGQIAPGTYANYPFVEQFGGHFTSLTGTISGSSSSPFGFSSCTGNLFQHCLAYAGFNPLTYGVKAANLALSDFDYNYTTVVTNYTLVGTGAPSTSTNLVVSLSGQGALALSNIGSTDETVGSISLSGDSPQDFSVGTATCTYPSMYPVSAYPVVARGVQCFDPIAFTPHQPGFSTAVVTVANPTEGKSYSLPLYGGSLSAPVVSPSQLSFPTETIGAVSAPQSVIVTRPSADPVTAYTSTSLQSVKGTCASGEAPCILTFVFSPTATPDNYPSISVLDAALSTGADVAVQALTITPVIPASASISPSSLTFPARAPNTESIPQTFTLTNGGPAPLGVGYIGLSGANSSEFGMQNICGSSIPANASCSISINFAPVSAGPKSASLVITGAQNSGLPLTIPLNGTPQ